MLRRSAPSRLPFLRVGDLELNTVTRAKLGEDDWLILDSLPTTIEGESTRLHVVASCAQIDQTSCVFKAIFAFGIPQSRR